MDILELTTAYTSRNGTNATPYVKVFDDSATIVSGVFIFIFLLVGVALNTLTIIVIQGTSSLRNIFMFFIVSLCASDLMSAFISPLFWYRRTVGFDVWMPPNFFCKLFWAVDLMTSFSTSMHILNFAILRYISIAHPILFRKISKRAGRIWILVTWLVAFLCGFVPMWMFTGADPGVKRDRTSDAKNAKWPACTLLLSTLNQYETFSLTAYSIFLLSPMAVVIVVSVFIARSVHQHTKRCMISDDAATKKRLRKEKQAVIQLVLIVVSFLFGYVPFVTYEIWSLFSSAPVVDYWFGLGQYFCLRFSECMNPIFYNISSSKMRRHTRNFLRKCCSVCPNYLQNKVTPGSSPPSQTTTFGQTCQMGV